MDLSSGRVQRTLRCPLLADPVAVDDLVFGVAYDPDNGYWVCGARLSSGEEAWRSSTKLGNFKPGMACASASAGFLGLGDGTVLALSLADGREIWRKDVADLAYQDPHHGLRPGRLVGVPCIWKDAVICRVWPGHVVALALTDGSRLWTWHHPGAAIDDGYLYDDQYHVNTGLGSYHILDPATGSELFTTDLRKCLPTKLSRVVPHGPMLVSETHLFLGTMEGYILAFRRDTGRFVWSHLPKGGTGMGSYFVAANRRFYYTDMSFRLYCLKESGPMEPAESGSGK